MANPKREVENKINALDPAQTTANELGRIVERLDEVIPILQDIKQQEIQFPEVQSVKMDQPLSVQMELPEMPEVQFPDVQKVEVINQIQIPEPKAPIVNVPAPIVKVEAPIVNVPEMNFPKEMDVKVTNFPEPPKPKEIQKVELVDKNGKPVNMQPIVNVSQPSYPSAFNYGGHIDTVKVNNTTSNPVPINDFPQTLNTTLTAINTVYNNTTTTATSASIACSAYRFATFSYEIVSASTPTDILFEIEMSLDGTNYGVLQNDFLGDLRYDDTAVATQVLHSVTFPIGCANIRVKATATGTTASLTFTVTNANLYLRN